MKPYGALRDFIELLETKQELVRITKEVDKDWEISTITRKVWMDYKDNDRPTLLFERVKDYAIPVVMGVYATQRRVALSLGIDQDNARIAWERTRDIFVRAEEEQHKPNLKERGLCQENVLTGDQVDILSVLPVPTWTPDKDASPYITAGGTASKDPETGELSVGNYRLQVKGPRKLGVFPAPGQDLFFHWKKASALNQALPVAVLIGNNPAILYTQIYKVPYCEYDLAGGLLGGPLDTVKARTVDIEVPADTEIVIEGYMPPNYREEEGPFGEAFGVVSPKRMNPVIEITALTFRNNPIYHAFMSSGVPGTAGSTRAAVKPFWVYNTLKRAGVPEVHDVYMPEAGTGSQIVFVAIKKQWEFHPRHVMYALWGSKNNYDCKFVVVTDSDVNVRDDFELMRAIFMCVEPSRDVVIISQGGSHEIDPTTRSVIAAKMGIDATRPYEYDVSLPSDEYLQRVSASWTDYNIHSSRHRTHNPAG